MDQIIEFFSGNYWASFEALITIITLVLVAKNYFDNRRQNDNISILIDGKSISQSILRKHFTRAEVKGVLREVHIPHKDEKNDYKIEYIAKSDFIDKVLDIQTGTQKELNIQIKDSDRFHMEAEK